MRCDEIMKKNVECIAESDDLRVAAARMRDHNVGFLPVCDSARKVLGTLTDRDIAVRAVAAGKGPGTPVSDVMTREVIACRPSDDLHRAAQLLTENKKSRILCTNEEGRLFGVISLSDLAQHDQEATARTLRGVTTREAPSA